MSYILNWKMPADLRELLNTHKVETMPVGTDLTYKGKRYIVREVHSAEEYDLEDWQPCHDFFPRRIAPITPPNPPAVEELTTVADTLDLSLRKNLEELISRVLHLNPDCPEIGLGMLSHLQSLASMVAIQLQGAACTSDDSGSDF